MKSMPVRQGQLPTNTASGHWSDNQARLQRRRWSIARVATVAVATIVILAPYGVSARQTKASRTAAGRPHLASPSAKPTPTIEMSGKLTPLYGPIMTRSIAARDNSPVAVQAFVDEIFVQTGFGGAAESLTKRLAKQELAYRGGKAQSIDVDTFVEALNKTVKRPSFHYFRLSRSAVSTSCVRSNTEGLWNDDDDPDSLSPTGDILHCSWHQKFFNVCIKWSRCVGAPADVNCEQTTREFRLQ